MPKRARPKKEPSPFVSRGGLKLAFALESFCTNVCGMVAADLGCHLGGFTDCLLQRGAARVYAVDTAYGILAWKLRNDPRVQVLERTNALHWRPADPVDLVTIDLGWTRQALALPAAQAMVRTGGAVLSLVKPQYEADRSKLGRGVLPPEELPAVLEFVKERIPPGLELLEEGQSPITGSGGNVELWLYLIRR